MSANHPTPPSQDFITYELSLIQHMVMLFIIANVNDVATAKVVNIQSEQSAVSGLLSGLVNSHTDHLHSGQHFIHVIILLLLLNPVTDIVMRVVEG